MRFKVWIYGGIKHKYEGRLLSEITLDSEVDLINDTPVDTLEKAYEYTDTVLKLPKEKKYSVIQEIGIG